MDGLDELPGQFGALVRRLRTEDGVSQERLAAVCGIDRAYMGALERGERNPSLTMMVRVARGLDRPLSELMTELRI